MPRLSRSQYGRPSPQQPPARSNTNSSDLELGAYPTTSSSEHQQVHMLPKEGRDVEEPRMRNTRTPSPTPSELKELKTGAINWKSLGTWRFWFRREWLWYYVALVVILVITALVTIYHKQIVHWLTPVTRWLHDFKFGWLVPIGVLFVISFPPLFGHEIVAILCGLVWGLWVGFGIVCAGTFLGEVGNFYAFKWCCRSRGEKMERTNISYACLAKVVRDGGFWIALIARLSAIPGHFTTAVFSTCGMGIIVFSLAAILSLPKQFITVYLGVILEQSGNGTRTTQSKIISDVVLGVTFLITVVAMWYIYRRMNQVKSDVIYQRRKARQAKLARSEYKPYASEVIPAFPPDQRQLDAVPLTSRASPYSSSSPAPYNPSPYSNPYPNNVANNPPTPLYAPQPRAPPPHLYEANASADDVGWDMRPMQHANPEVMYGHPRGSESKDTIGTTGTVVKPMGRAVGSDPYEEYDDPYGGMQDDHSPYHTRKTTSPEPQPLSQRQHPATLQPHRGPMSNPPSPSMQTPTQAQYATWTATSSPRQAESDLESDYVDVSLPLPHFNQTTTPMQSRPRGGTNSGSPPPPSYRSDAHGRP